MALAWILFLLFPKGKWKRSFLVVALFLSYTFTNMYLADRLMYWWEDPVSSFEDLNQYELGVVLTGLALTDRQPADRVYFARGADRITLAHRLYTDGIIKKILVTGGTGRINDEFVYPEANALYMYLRQVGVPDEDIILETEARNTYENAVFAAEIIQNRFREKPVLLITSAFHMRRARACFEKQELEFDTFAGDFYARGRRKYGLSDFVVPQQEALMLWTKLFKEWIGMIAYKAAGYI
jgi:uncharacterized SAM-binding protein YcdF (DUF218 family)